MLESVFLYSFQNKLYIWKKRTAKTLQNSKESAKETYQIQSGTRLDNSKLRDLAWSLDVLDLQKNSERQL